MENNFRMLYGKDLTDSIRELMIATSNLKSTIFRTLISGTVVDSSACLVYLSHVKGYLDFWESFSLDMNNKMKKSNPKTTRCVGYQVIKEFIYDKYDYNAMVSYTDALSMGIKDKKFTSKDDIDDFFKFTISKAFGNRDVADSVAGMVDYLVNLDRDEANISTDDNDRRMFNAIKNDKNLFDSRDRVSLYNNTKKIVEFLSDKAMVDKLLSTSSNSISLYIASVNSIMEFVTYSLSAYAARIYAINLFVYPHIYSSSQTEVKESAEINLPNTGDNNSVCVTIMRDADEAECRKVNNIGTLVDIFSRASTAIGADGKYNGKKPTWNIDGGVSNIYSYNVSSNIFSQKLFGNDLYNFIIERPNSWAEYARQEDSIKEMNLLIKDLMYNKTQGMGSTASPRNEFNVIIRGVTCDNTEKGYQSLFADLFTLTVIVCGNIYRMIISNNCISERSLNDKRMTFTVGTMANENVRLLSELYVDMVQLFLQKGRDIETKYNAVAGNDVHKIIGLNLGKATPKEVGTTSDITSAVPDTYRVPIDLTDLYALPAFEYFQFYDEAVKYNFHLDDDPYFSEAFNISEIINKIKSWIFAKIKSVQAWWNDKNLQAAINWVTKNGDKVVKMNFNGKSMNVLPFKNNGTTEDIDFSSIMSKILQAFANIKMEEDMESPEKIEEFIKKVYPDPVVYDWFKNEQKKGEAAAKLHSFMLFRDINNVISTAEKPVTITGNEINKRCAWWVDTCKNAKVMYDQIIKYSNEMNKGITTLQGKISNATSAKPAQEPLAEAPKDGDNDKGNNGNSANGSQPATPQKPSAPSAENVAIMVNELFNVVARVFDPMTKICVEYVNTEYRYIKQAHSLGTVTNQ